MATNNPIYSFEATSNMILFLVIIMGCTVRINKKLYPALEYFPKNASASQQILIPTTIISLDSVKTNSFLKSSGFLK